LASVLANDVILGELRDYVIRFVNTLNPNNGPGVGVPWPKWDSDPLHPTGRVIIFQDDTFFPIVLGNDDYRTDALSYVTNMSLIYPI